MLDLSRYDYNLPERLIATQPIQQRDQSKLFIYDTKTDKIKFDQFFNLPLYLPKNSLMVLNETKVVPARAVLKKQSGGKAEVLFFFNEPQTDGSIKCISDRKLIVGTSLEFPNGKKFIIQNQNEQFFFVEPKFPMSELNTLLEQYGLTPVPKYIAKAALPENEIRPRYQTVFAKNPSSVAAPTASLHFTKELLEQIKHSGVDQTYISLHVGMGTFAPINENNFVTRRLHEEQYEISEEASEKIKLAKLSGKPVIAVGTTAVRALESSAEKILSGQPIGKAVTDIFIFQPHVFQIPDCMITNFHLPKSSLMCLVDAFLQYKNSKRSLVDLYRIAIDNHYRFYSFGDSMLII